MPLVAHSRLTGERVDITLYKNPRTELPTTDLVCPECKSSMVLKAGQIKTAHFAHKAGSNCEYGTGETIQHLAGKRMLAEWLRKEVINAVAEIEYPIANRRADIAQIFPNGWVLVHEVQLASITTEKLQERTNDYMNAGCDVLWYFGPRTATPANKDWAMVHQGQVLFMEFNYERKQDTVDLLTG